MAYPNTNNPSPDFTSGIYTSDISPDAAVAAIIDNYTPVNKDGMRHSVGYQLSLVQNFVNKKYLGRHNHPVTNAFITTASGTNLQYDWAYLNSGVMIDTSAGSTSEINKMTNEGFESYWSYPLAGSQSGVLQKDLIHVGYSYSTDTEYTSITPYQIINRASYSLGSDYQFVDIDKSSMRFKTYYNYTGVLTDTHYRGTGIEAEKSYTIESATSMNLNAPYIYQSGIFQPDEVQARNGVSYVQGSDVSQGFKIASLEIDANFPGWSDKDNVTISTINGYLTNIVTNALRLNVVSVNAVLTGSYAGGATDVESIIADSITWEYTTVGTGTILNLGFPSEPSYGTRTNGDWRIRVSVIYY